MAGLFVPKQWYFTSRNPPMEAPKEEKLKEKRTSIWRQKLARLDFQGFVSSQVDASVGNDAQERW
jgi:hypothetical protein